MHSSTLFIALAGLASQASAYFHCPSVNETGFYPSCCHAVVGQVGIWCTSATIVGGLPNYECNSGPPLNLEGCCQSLNYTNPETNYTISLCTDAIPVTAEE